MDGIDRLWAKVGPLFDAQPVDAPIDVATAERALGAYFARVFADEAVAASFALPGAYRRFLEVANHGWISQRVPRRFDFWLAGTSDLVSSTTYHGNVWVPRDGPVQRHLGAWVVVGSHGDHHRAFVCCDAGPGFGEVGVFEDRHPWMGGDPDATFASFTHWLRAECTGAVRRVRLEPAAPEVPDPWPKVDIRELWPGAGDDD